MYFFIFFNLIYLRYVFHVELPIFLFFFFLFFFVQSFFWLAYARVALATATPVLLLVVIARGIRGFELH